MTWFPHGVLEVKLALPEGEEAPGWVTDLTTSGLLHEARPASPATHIVAWCLQCVRAV